MVLDAPPTGRISQFLNVNNELAGLAKVGPIRSQADTVMTLLRSKRTAVHLVTVLEDMPVQETADGDRRAAGRPACRSAGRGQHDPPRRSSTASERDAAISGELDREAVAADLEKVGVKPTETLLDGLLAEAREHAERRELEDEQRKRITAIDVPAYELPRLPDGIDLGALYELAADLCKQGLA